MTLEEKANMYADEHYADKDETGDWLSDEEMLRRAYIAGATENGIVWHDLRKNPQDLPNKSKHVVQNQDGDPVVYNNNQKKWFWTDGCYFGLKVIAWAEIPKFEE